MTKDELIARLAFKVEYLTDKIEQIRGLADREEIEGVASARVLDIINLCCETELCGDD